MNRMLRIPHLSPFLLATTALTALTRKTPLSPLVLIAALTAIIAATVAFTPPAEASSPPDAPNNVSGIRTGQTIKVTWTGSTGDTHYNINHTNDDKRSWQLSKSNHDSSPYTIHGTWLNADYTFAVQACNASGQCSGWTNSNLVAGASTPNPPSVVNIKHEGDKVKFWWPKPSGGASTYDIVVSKNHKASWSRLFTGYRQNVAHIKNGDASKTYYIGIRACNYSGNGGARACSGWRNSTGAASQAPNSVASISATYTGKSLSATWTSAKGATKYHATYSCKAGQSLAFGNDHRNIAGTSRTIIMPQSQADASSCWVSVRAGNANGWSKWKDSAPSQVAIPDGVSSVTLEHKRTSLAISYTASARATKYRSQYKCGALGTWSDAGGETAETSAAVTLSGQAEQDAACTARTRAGNGAGWSDWTESAEQRAAPENVSGLSVTNTTGHWNLSWDEQSGQADSYKIESKVGSGPWTAQTGTTDEESQKYDHATVDVTQKTNFRVQACNTLGRCSGWEETGLSPNSGPNGEPSGVTGTRPTSKTQTTYMDIYWNSPDNAAYYHLVYWRKGVNEQIKHGDEIMTTKQYPFGNKPTMNWTRISGLPCNTEYGFDVAARNAHGYSAGDPWHNRVWYKTQDCP